MGRGVKDGDRTERGRQHLDVCVADREADINEPIQLCQQRGVDFVIRACQNRRLADEAGRLWDKLNQAVVAGQGRD